jgi:hypothetical protein
MIFPFAVAAAAQLIAPSNPLAGQLRSAIWDDLGRNALIGNGNWIASLWYRASNGDANTPDLHIADLMCRSRKDRQDCSFTLHRDGGVKNIDGETAPDRLRCRANVVLSGAGQWMVKHIPPRKVGHSRTTLRCNQLA